MKNEFVDFTNTEIAFSHKTNRELKRSALLFRLMNYAWLVDFLSWLARWAVKLSLPFSETVIKRTIFKQFVGGESLDDCANVIQNLKDYQVLVVLDYGAEGKSAEEDLDTALENFLDAVRYAAKVDNIPVVSVKVSALAKNNLLERKQSQEKLNEKDTLLFERVRHRLNKMCELGASLGVKIFIDAEESWIQDTIDHLVEEMMATYNKDQVFIYQTYQLYRHDRLQYLYDSFAKAQKEGYMLGAKLVRGAYMEKERERAEDKDFPSPIHRNKAATDHDFNKAIAFCVDHYKEMASCTATHNMESCLYKAELIGKRNLPARHAHLNFCQLYGMSDHITYNLAAAGYNVAKYVVYGPVKEIVPYLIRRAEENTAVSGEFSREYQLITTEVKRRNRHS